MRSGISRLRLLSAMLPVLALAGTATIGDRPTLAQTASRPCHVLTSAREIPDGFGAAYNLFSSAKEDLLSVTCSSSQAILHVGNGQSTTYIYRLGYELLDGRWSPIAFGGQKLVSKDWYVGSAFANLARSETQLAQDNLVVAYTCHWINNQWKCGCRDETCAQSLWQLQKFKQTADAWGPIPGMELHWSWTPQASDEGKTGDAAGYWFHPPSTPYAPMNSAWKANGSYRIAQAPDGKLGFEILAPQGEHFISDIKITLWPNDVTKSPKVWRQRFRMYLQNNHLAARGDTGLKMPGGMVYGPQGRAGNSPFSKAGESCPGAGPFRLSQERGASVRLQPGGSLRWPLYIYHVPNPGSDCPFRSFTAGDKNVEVGKWIDIEMEYSNQSAAGRADGYAKLWIDGELVVDKTRVLWVAPQFPPQGFRGIWFNYYNGGAPTPFKQDTRLWIRDVEVWVKR